MKAKNIENGKLIRKRTAIIELETFCGYTGTVVPCGYKFLCWDDDPKARDLIKDKEVISIEIPVFISPLDESLRQFWDNPYDERWNNT